MRWPNSVLAVSVVLMIAAGGFAWSRTRAAQPPGLPPGLTIDDARHPVYVDSTLAPAAVPETVVVTAQDATVTGLATVMLFPEDQGRPHFGRWTDASGAQTKEHALDLRRWNHDKRPTGRCYALLAAWIDREGRRELRVGWSHFEIEQLAMASVSVELPARKSAEIRVVDHDGHAVPGAFVVVDEAGPETSGVTAAAGFTDDEGVLRVSGLEPARAWTACLPEGAGPWPKRVETALALGGARTELRVDGIAGSWTYVRHELALSLPGASTRVTMMAPVAGAATDWPVSRWIGPGRGPVTAFWTMRRAGSPSTPTALGFEGHESVTVEDPGRPQRILLSLRKQGPAAALGPAKAPK